MVTIFIRLSANSIVDYIIKMNRFLQMSRIAPFAKFRHFANYWIAKRTFKSDNMEATSPYVLDTAIICQLLS